MNKHIKSFNDFVKNDSLTTELRVEDYFDISSITKKDIVSITNDMRVFLQSKGFGDVILCKNDKIIAESTTIALPVLELRKKLITMGFKRWQVVSTVVVNKVRIVILYADIAKNTQTIITEMKSMGWDKVNISEPVEIHGVMCRVMDFDPSSQRDLTKDDTTQN